MNADFTDSDKTGSAWELSDNLDATAVVTFHRGDF
jgi:hypothetical protein